MPVAARIRNIFINSNPVSGEGKELISGIVKDISKIKPEKTGFEIC
jgi:hypothetical protein